MTDHERYRDLTAGFVLGALDPGERRAFESHMTGCAECRDDVASFAPIPGLLSRVDGLDAEQPLPDRVAERAAAAARSEWRSLDRRRRSWRWTAAVAALAALVLATVSLLPHSDGSDGPEPTALAVQPGVASGAVTIESRPWGTAVHLELDNLPQRDRYVAWVTDGNGARQQAATWGPTPAGIALLDGASSIRADQVTSVVVTDAADSEILLTALTRS